MRRLCQQERRKAKKHTVRLWGRAKKDFQVGLLNPVHQPAVTFPAEAPITVCPPAKTRGPTLSPGKICQIQFPNPKTPTFFSLALLSDVMRLTRPFTSWIKSPYRSISQWSLHLISSLSLSSIILCHFLPSHDSSIRWA